MITANKLEIPTSQNEPVPELQNFLADKRVVAVVEQGSKQRLAVRQPENQCHKQAMSQNSGSRNIFIRLRLLQQS